MIDSGWFVVAYQRELVDPLTPAALGSLRLAVVRRNATWAVIDAACPHRGANLNLGQLTDDGAIRCGFHGCVIGIGEARGPWRARELEVIAIGGQVFARTTPLHDHGFTDAMHALAATHQIYPGLVFRTAAAPGLVIENAFDQAHFRPVHGIHNTPVLVPHLTPDGALRVDGEFVVPPSRWQRSSADELRVPYQATAYSPWLVVSTMGGDHPYVVLTGATPAVGGGAVIRLSVAAPGPAGRDQDQRCRYLIEQSRKGLELDNAIWENSALRAPGELDCDDAVRAFRGFVTGFATGSLAPFEAS